MQKTERCKEAEMKLFKKALFACVVPTICFWLGWWLGQPEIDDMIHLTLPIEIAQSGTRITAELPNTLTSRVVIEFYAGLPDTISHNITFENINFVERP